eukprot:365158-Chlamydomonas_euryale.AAC.2
MSCPCRFLCETATLRARSWPETGGLLRHPEPSHVVHPTLCSWHVNCGTATFGLVRHAGCNMAGPSCPAATQCPRCACHLSCAACVACACHPALRRSRDLLGAARAA